MKIADGSLGYYNFQYVYTDGGETNLWAFDVTFYAGGVVDIYIAGEHFSAEYDDSEGWFHIAHEIDLDADTAKVILNGVVAHEWQYSVVSQGDGNGRIDAIDFWDHTDPPGGRNFIDNIVIDNL